MRDVVIADWREAGRTVTPFAQELIDGVASHLPEIDPLLEEHSEGWTVARMATLDRTIMRIAVFELMYRADIPTSVAISEAVEAATELSSDESRRYVNGILGRIARELGRPETEQPADGADRRRKSSTREGTGRDSGLGVSDFGSVESVGSSTLPSLMPFLNSPWARPTERAISGSFFAPNSTTTATMPTTIHSGPIYPTTFHII